MKKKTDKLKTDFKIEMDYVRIKAVHFLLYSDLFTSNMDA